MNCFEKFVVHHQKYMIDALGGSTEAVLFNQMLANQANPEMAVPIEDARQVINEYAAPFLCKVTPVSGSALLRKSRKGLEVITVGTSGAPLVGQILSDGPRLDLASVPNTDHVGKAVAVADEAILCALCDGSVSCYSDDITKTFQRHGYEIAVKPMDGNLGKRVSRFMFESEPVDGKQVYCHALVKDYVFFLNKSSIEFLLFFPVLKDAEAVYCSISVSGKIGNAMACKIKKR